ncbi:hypothetical protein HDU81_006907 [Chytriomyces hyalinus]|nr:hypothetical protein HDU81_006907 [Chytriomyces hyalinus]
MPADTDPSPSRLGDIGGIAAGMASNAGGMHAVAQQPDTMRHLDPHPAESLFLASEARLQTQPQQYTGYDYNNYNYNYTGYGYGFGYYQPNPVMHALDAMHSIHSTTDLTSNDSTDAIQACQSVPVSYAITTPHSIQPVEQLQDASSSARPRSRKKQKMAHESTPVTSSSSSSAPSHPSSSATPVAGAAPATLCPATRPTILVRDEVEWIEFTYEVKGKATLFEIRTDIDDMLDLDALDEAFKARNCVYPGARVEQELYKGNRYKYESSVNTIGWKLCHINPSICGQKGLIQRAVDSFRNRFDELKSRRLMRHQKFQNGTLRRRPSTSTEKSVDLVHASDTLGSSPLQMDTDMGSTTPLNRVLCAKSSLDTGSKWSAGSGSTSKSKSSSNSSSSSKAAIITPRYTDTPMLSSRSSVTTPLTPFDSVSRQLTQAVLPITPPPPVPESLIGQHLVTKAVTPKSLCVETVQGGTCGTITKYRIRVDIERVDDILYRQGQGVAALQTQQQTALEPEVREDAIRRFASSIAFRRGNCVFPRALDSLAEFKCQLDRVGLNFVYSTPEEVEARYHFEVLMNEVAWRIAVLNRKGLTSGEYGGNGCRETLQKAVSTYRARFMEGFGDEY